MLLKQLRLCTILLLGLRATGLQAQISVAPTGGTASGSGGSASYTLGQVAYTINIGANGSVAQGVQQPFEISVPTSLQEAKEIELIFSAYPNPSSDILTLDAKLHDYQNLSYMIYDFKGNLVENHNVTSDRTQIIMAKYVSGTYFLKIMDRRKVIKTFKIIKTK